MRRSLAGKMLLIYIPCMLIIAAVMVAMIVSLVNQPQPNPQVMPLLVGAVVCLLLFFIVVLTTTLVLTRPLQRLVSAAKAVARGELDADMSTSSNDEIGQVTASLAQIASYQKRISTTVADIADGNFAAQIVVASDRDILGQNINRMLTNLKKLVQELKIEADRLQSASEKLAVSSYHAGDAAAQISTTIQQIARGVSSSTESISRTAGSIDEMTHSIGGIAKGAQEQAKGSTATPVWWCPKPAVLPMSPAKARTKSKKPSAASRPFRSVWRFQPKKLKRWACAPNKSNRSLKPSIPSPPKPTCLP